MTRERHLAWLGRWSVACAAVVCFHLGSVMPAWSDNCKPAADEIALYTENGKCVVKGIGKHSVIQLPGQDVRSRQLPRFVSIILGGRVEALACSEPKLTGTCIVVSRSLKTFANERIRFAMSVVVRDADRPLRCTPEANKVAVWDYQYFFGDCQVFNLGAYPTRSDSCRPAHSRSVPRRGPSCVGAAFSRAHAGTSGPAPTVPGATRAAAARFAALMSTRAGGVATCRTIR